MVGKTRRIVLDTNVLVSALRSRNGASFRLVSLIGSGQFETLISVPLLLEYEATITRLAGQLGLTEEDIAALLDYIVSVSKRQRIFYLWRPVLSDAKDDMVLELAVAGDCDTIVTYNKADFRGCTRFGVRTVDPREYLLELGG